MKGRDAVREDERKCRWKLVDMPKRVSTTNVTGRVQSNDCPMDISESKPSKQRDSLIVIKENV